MLRKLLIVTLLCAVTNITAVAEDKNNYDMMAGMSYPMQKSMDPQVWMQMMTMMMDPARAMSMENCALCHQDDDLARYAKDFGPMMEASQQMAQWMSPHQMMQAMNPMMMGMMNPMMMGGMNPMMMGGMNPMMGMGGHGANNPMGQMMNPEQYTNWFNQMSEMMKQFTPPQSGTE